MVYMSMLCCAALLLVLILDTYTFFSKGNYVFNQDNRLCRRPEILDYHINVFVK